MMTPQTFLLTFFSSLFILSLQTSLAKPSCTPSACGIIRNISSPFRLKDDPNHCGHRKYELACENNVTSFYINSHKYYVKEINYDNSTIWLVDACINNHTCSFLNCPAASYHDYNFMRRALYLDLYPYHEYNQPINFMSCAYPLKNSSLFIEDTHCSSNSSHARYTYIKLGRMKAEDVPETCELELIVMTSWFKDLNNVSLSEIHHSRLYGFQLLFWRSHGVIAPSNLVLDKLGYDFVTRLQWPLLVILVIVALLSAGIIPPVMAIIGFAIIIALSLQLAIFKYWQGYIDPTNEIVLILIMICAPRFIICPFMVGLLIYKFRRRRLSLFEGIECFLQSENKLTLIRYSYSDVKKMTRGFQDKLGEGGYGSVYKGKLRSGHDVAVKLLGKSGANGQDFINEIATIGRIHHINVVKLVGYCAQGSKRALVFDFMPNGSLEKYIFNREKMISLNLDKKFEIAVGVARGIQYLHRGCDIQILHFDIKPHNILLDDKFIPKISDFGLAKIFSTDKNTVTMTAARGTIGYVAPELINRSIGAVSYKADVYSFGMLLMEIVSLKRDLIENNGDSSQYFPNWIYDCFNQGKDFEIGKANENDDNYENDSTRNLARKMTIVALWCIQMNPNDRPSMNKVLEMLEGDVERLHLPEYPSQSTQIVVNMDQTGITWSTDSVSLLCQDDASPNVEISVQE